MPNPHEVARLIVAGTKYEDWESVYVQHRWQEGWPTFRFTATEGGGLTFVYRDLKFKPGDPCQIELGGQLAVTGIITQRQVAYAATEHGVQLSGVGKSWAAATSSVNSDNNQNNFDGKNVIQASMQAVAGVKGKLKVIGTPLMTPFERLQAQPGERVWDFLDKIARMKNATLGSDHLGNLLLIGDHTNPIVQQLTEGQNILKMQCVFSNEAMFSIYKLSGQHAISDDKMKRMTNEIMAKATGGLRGAERFIEYVTENPLLDLQARANYEALKADGTQIRCNVTVQGWLRDGGALWATGDNVTIYSPMCPLNLGMKIQTATFTQDTKSGTTTVLECVLPWMLGDKLYQLGNPKQTPESPPQPPPPASNVA